MKRFPFFFAFFFTFP
ncbi:TPA: hypothetical protein QHR59_004861 [Klebsiella aerogenes]|nr:hypothetical protein [Klebsiella aerogenes]EIV5435249.1 hypothetical protein [Klebsiella aerogenes]ELA2560421.1 hypothetical protein [Klebsiella aerogenes]HDS4350505.1 hypothetical protein [Klebsiella aerogenes]HDS5835622.1 hypothetical protein [Klebsiella aerogenes]HDS6483296.1 hypothetical protein [Klebsiella aerogenes]